MLFYRILPDTMGLGPACYKGTAAEAHVEAKALANRSDVRVELIEVATDKAGVLRLLNGVATIDALNVTQTWKLSPRGGLVDCPNGE